MTPELTRGSKLKTEGSQWHGPTIRLQSEESVGCSCRPRPGANTVRHGQKILSELFFFFSLHFIRTSNSLDDIHHAFGKAICFPQPTDSNVHLMQTSS